MADPESLRTIMGTPRRMNRLLNQLLLTDQICPPINFVEEAGTAVLTFRPKEPQFTGHRGIALIADELPN